MVRKPEGGTAKQEEATDAARPEVAGLRPVDVPILYASAIQVQATSTDVSMIFSRARPAMRDDGMIVQEVAIPEVTVVVQMSHHTFKDLVVVCSGILQKREEQFGVIETDFTRRIAAGEAKGQKKLQ